MKTAVLLTFVLILLVFSGLYSWRFVDHWNDRAESDRLLKLRKSEPPLFLKGMVEGLPDPAKRYFLFTIKEGTPLYTVAEISMHGKFGMGNKTAPNYMLMKAEQVLAPPEGFIWKMSGGLYSSMISGSDSAKWTRFWLAHVIPVARAGGTEDHTLSGFARYISEAIFWTPAAVLPQSGITWDAVNDNTARLTVKYNGMHQSVDVTVDQDGRPVRIMLQRWSNANEDAEYRFQPFGGHLSDFREFQGFTLPTHVEAGNLIGTNDYFPFFIADVTNIRFR